MLIIMRSDADEESVEKIKEYLIDREFDIHQSTGVKRTIIGVIGDTDALHAGKMASMRGVLQVVRIAKEE